MKKLRNAILVLLAALVGALGFVWASFQPPGPPQPLSEAFTLENVTILNPNSGSADVVNLTVRNGAITDIVPAASGAPDALPQFNGMYVTPGLVDMHVHLPPDNVLQLTQHALLLYLAHGVTAVRDAGDVDGTATPAAKALVASGEYPGPRIFSCGPFVTAGEPRWPNSVILHSPDDARPAVQQIKDASNTWVKSYENLSVDMIRALENAADELGLQVMGHVPEALTYEQALIRDVQHCLGVPKLEGAPGMLERTVDWSNVDDARMQEIVAVTLQHGLANTPTLVSLKRIGEYNAFAQVYSDPVLTRLPDFYLSIIWHPQRGIPVYRNLEDAFFTKQRDTLAKKQRLVKMLHDAGAQLYLGSDTLQPFVVPGAALQEEMTLFAEAGIPNQAVWRYATADAGHAMKLDGLGTIAKNAPADLLIFRQNPINDLAALNTLEAVIANGKLYQKSDIDKKLEAFQNHYAKFPVKQLAAFFAQLAVNKAAQNFTE